MRLANGIHRSGRIPQRQARQALQGGALVQHLAALAPGGVQHHQAQLCRVHELRRIQGCWHGVACVIGGRVEQHGVPGLLQQCLQGRCVKALAHHHAAVGQAQVQQARAVLGVPHLQRVLQDQDFGRLVRGRDPLADAHAGRARAHRAAQAGVGRRGRHAAQSTCAEHVQSTWPGPQRPGADNPHMTANTPTAPLNTPAGAPDFAQLALSPAMLANLQQLGYASMTPIQAASLPLALEGRDLIAQAQTGSGKTAAFALPLLSKLNPRWFAVQALVLCPTRELADQVTSEIRRIARAEENIKVVTLCGGIALRGQRASLEHGAHIVVGTPGRIMDHLERGYLTLEGLNTLVLDEADRMLDMGFFDDIAKVIAQAPKERQTLLFSATYPEGIEKLSNQFMRAPQRITVAAPKADNKIEQRFYQVERLTRLKTVGMLLNHFRPVSTLAFCNTKQQCKDLVTLLQEQGFAALALYGELEQRERDQVLAQFANRSCSVLVATDVASRGLDIKELEAVINVDITPDPEVHVHRVGRTGRAGESGLALSLASMHEMGFVGKIEQYQNTPSVWFKLEELTAASDQPLLPPMACLQILGGRKEKIRPGDVLGALTNDEGGPAYTREQIGKIQVTEFCTFVAVSRELAKAACAKLNAGKVKGKSVRARIL